MSSWTTGRRSTGAEAAAEDSVGEQGLDLAGEEVAEGAGP
jgi:hypothetical protein